MYDITKFTMYKILNSCWRMDWAPNSISPMRPAKIPPISNVHHSRHTMIILGMATRMNMPQSCRQSMDHPDGQSQDKQQEQCLTLKPLGSPVFKPNNNNNNTHDNNTNKTHQTMLVYAVLYSRSKGTKSQPGKTVRKRLPLQIRCDRLDTL